MSDIASNRYRSTHSFRLDGNDLASWGRHTYRLEARISYILDQALDLPIADQTALRAAVSSVCGDDADATSAHAVVTIHVARSGDAILIERRLDVTTSI